MSNLWSTAERLRLVKRAYVDFITAWVLDVFLDCPKVADRICRDVMAVEDSALCVRSGLFRSGNLDD